MGGRACCSSDTTVNWGMAAGVRVRRATHHKQLSFYLPSFIWPCQPPLRPLWCRLSPLGCALAATVLRYPPAACKPFAEALAALTPGQLAAAARDSGGCRVLEAYLEVQTSGAGTMSFSVNRLHVGGGCRVLEAYLVVGSAGNTFRNPTILIIWACCLVGMAPGAGGLSKGGWCWKNMFPTSIIAQQTPTLVMSWARDF